MNAEIGLLQRATQRDVDAAGGLEGLRKLALNTLKLRTVAKESHGSEIRRLAFNHITSGCGNLLASLAKDQVTVYDDSYMQDHLHVAIQYCLEADKHPGGEFAAMCWVSGSRWTRHPFGDAVLAVGGTTGAITVISVVASQVIAELPVGEGTSVAELASAAGSPGLLVALLGDGGTAQLWDVRSGTCLRTWATEGEAMALHPSGSTLVTTDRAGTLSSWQLLQLASPGAGTVSISSEAAVSTSAPLTPTAAAAAQECVLEVDDWQQHLGSFERSVLEVPELGGAALDGLAVLPGDRLLVKALDGRMWVLQLPTCTTLVTWKVPGFSSNSSSSHSHNSSKRCLLGHNTEGRLVCIGNPHGSSYVYEARTGQQLAVQAPFRVDGPARATAVSDDGRHLLAAVGHGYLFRYEYNSLRAQQEREQQQKQQEAEEQQQLLELEQQRLQEEAEQLQALEQAAPTGLSAATEQPAAAAAGAGGSAAAQEAGTVDAIEQDEQMTDVAPPPPAVAATGGSTGSPTPIASTPVAAGGRTALQHSPGLQNMDLDQPRPAAAAASEAAATEASTAPRQPLSALDVQGSLPGAGAAGAAALAATPQHTGQAAGDGQVPSSSKRQKVEGAAGVSKVEVSPLLFRRTP